MKQHSLKEVMKLLSTLPGAKIDVGFRQGHDAVMRQLQLRTGQHNIQFVDDFIEGMKDELETLQKEVAPCDLPHEYIDFLELYGGMAIFHDDFYFQVFGLGPMVEDWYASIVSDATLAVPDNPGYISIGELKRRDGTGRSNRLHYVLDLSGVVDRHCVISVERSRTTPLLTEVLANLMAYPDRWQKVANSFNAWLNLIADTAGRLGH